MKSDEAIRTISEFRMLDDGEVLEGYLDGFSGLPIMSDDRSRSYTHGWRNGMIESERWPPDKAYDELKHAFEVRRSAN